MTILVVVTAVALAVAAVLVVLLCVVAWVACRRRRAGAALLSSSAASEAGDIIRPLLYEDLDVNVIPSSNLSRRTAEESGFLVDSGVAALANWSLGDGGCLTKVHVREGEDQVVDVIRGSPEGLQHVTTDVAAETLVATDVKQLISSEEDVKVPSLNGTGHVLTVKDDKPLISNIVLEVIAGPSCGSRFSRTSSSSQPTVTLGRVPPADLVMNGSEVSSKHALISWNTKRLKWELVDLGSLNGTLLNSQAVHRPDGSRNRTRSDPVEVKHGDVITVGPSSKISVKIFEEHHLQLPDGVGVASDPMTARRRGENLPMEDMCFCQYPLPGVGQFGLFCIFDGHGGDAAAITASRMLPDNITKLLANIEEKERMLSYSSDVLRRAFTLTEAAMDHQYEGCTATVLLIWFNQNRDCFAQCANVGDSACVMNVDGEHIVMTEDHRITSMNERSRIASFGEPLKDNETRISGLNLGRMLGDKFLKENDGRFSSEPHISRVVQIPAGLPAFAVIASDGLWDVITTKKAIQLVRQCKESEDQQNCSAEQIAKRLLTEARTLRTKDNTSVIYVDLDVLRMCLCL